MIVALPGLFSYLFLVYKLRKIVGKPEFSDHSRKIIIQKGYHIDAIKHSDCLAVNTSQLTTLLTSLIARRWVGVQTL